MSALAWDALIPDRECLGNGTEQALSRRSDYPVEFPAGQQGLHPYSSTWHRITFILNDKGAIFMRGLMILAMLALSMAFGTNLWAEDKTDKPEAKANSIYDFKVKDIDGKEVDLSKYKGKVLLIVNVASRCGHTPQYETLEKLYKDKKDKGLVILGFPANEFGGQEPGTNEEIKTFCTSKYNVTFDMFSKIVVKGDGQAPLYKYLTSEAANPKTTGDIKWNFTKFLVSRDGKILTRFEPKVKPDSKEVLDAIDAALEQGK
jgi:glutathione peroxidase